VSGRRLYRTFSAITMIDRTSVTTFATMIGKAPNAMP